MIAPKSRPKVRGILIVVSAFVVNASCSSPTTPCVDQYGRGDTMLNHLALLCANNGSQLLCQAEADIAGLYVYCPQQKVVTADAQWIVGDPSIVANTAPGAFAAVSTGHTLVHAVWQRIDSSGTPVAVFGGTSPLLTGDIEGRVSEAGSTPPKAIDAAIVEVTNGPMVGAASTTGVPAAPLPGYSEYFGGSGSYRIEGVPSGTYHLRITKNGYVSQERDVTLPALNGSAGGGTAQADFQLVRQ